MRISLVFVVVAVALAIIFAGGGSARAQEQWLQEPPLLAEVMPLRHLSLSPDVLRPEPPDEQPSLLTSRVMKYTSLALRHKLSGLASYYSRSLDGSLTATGEIFRNKRFTAAHLTLPLGTWIEVTSRATGKKIRVRVNDRGPYARKFMLDLSKAAAHALGVDVTEDRHVEVRVIALPGEDPLPLEWEVAAGKPAASETVATTQR